MNNLSVFSRSVVKNIRASDTLNYSFSNNLSLLRNKRFYSFKNPFFTKNTNYFYYSTKHNSKNNNNNNNNFNSKIWLSTVIVAAISGSFGYYLNNFPSVSPTSPVSKQNIQDSKSTLSINDIHPLTYNTNKEQIENLLVELKNVLDNDPDNYTNTSSELKQHSDSDFNTHHPSEDQRPIIILFPHTTEQVSKLLKLCHDANVPVVPFSGGSSLEGHFLPTRYPTVCIDISKYMDNIIK